MEFYFTLALILITGITGIFWIGDLIWRFLLKRRRHAAHRGNTHAWLYETSRGFFPIFFIIFVVRAFIVEPFHIPSGSMMPSVLVGDYVVAEKFAFGLRVPLTHHVFIHTGHVQRGDVVVFFYPPNPKVVFIKRVIGLPGDTIRYTCNNQLYINGKQVQETRIGPYKHVGNEPYMPGAQLYREKLPRRDGHYVTHDILLMPNRATACGTWIVPPHEYFMMGDNRDDSDDSRYWGFVPAGNLIGPAKLIFFNFQGWTKWPLWNRIGTILH